MPGVNPFAVAHTQVWRGLTSDFNSAILIAVASGNSYYDRIESQYVQYYWIRHVSINGTYAEFIGPASALARPMLEVMMQRLAQQIDAGYLAQSLRSEIDKISLVRADLTTEVANRVAAELAAAQATGDLQAGLTNALAYINSEITARTTQNSALVQSLDVLAATTSANLTAAIAQEQLVRADAIGALASDVQALFVTNMADINAAILSEQTARIAEDSALASQINTVEASIGDSFALAQTTLQASVNELDNKVGALYTAKVNVNGLVGGFGIYNDGSEVEAGFDVDTFWVGKTGADKIKPFVISNGITYIREAAIEKLTFNKLRSGDGSFVVENGKIKADFLQVGEIMGGAYTSYAWPSSGTGFYLGPSGLRIGNINTSRYFEVTSTGNISAPSFSIVDGAATFSGSLSAARIGVGTASNATTFFDPSNPTIQLRSVATGQLSHNGDTATTTIVSGTCGDDKGGYYSCSVAVVTPQIITGDAVTFVSGDASIPIARRVRAGTVRLNVVVSAIADHWVSLWVQRNGGNWVWLTTTVEAQNGYGTVSITFQHELNLTTSDWVRFGISATNSNMQYWNGGQGWRDLRFMTMTAFATNF
jgi:hypothetical protein